MNDGESPTPAESDEALQEPSVGTRAISSAEVLKKEAEQIRQLRTARMIEIAQEAGGTRSPALRKDTENGSVGLAFSGGGIRSATFNLGVLQGLAQSNLLAGFDYLSTVSGGGYIGSWLIAWIKRAGFAKVANQLNPAWNTHGSEEPGEITFLRDYSNYLTPKLGILSADTWTAVTFYLRNLLLNLIILLAVMIAILFAPRFVVSVFPSLRAPIIAWTAAVLLVISFVFFFWEVYAIWNPGGKLRGASQGFILKWIMAPFLAGAFFLTAWLLNNPRSRIVSLAHPGVIAAGGLSISLVFWVLLGWAIDPSSREVPTWVLLVAVAGFGILSLSSAVWLVGTLAPAGGQWDPVHAVALGVPLYLLSVLVVGAMQLGLTGLFFRNFMREWTTRLGAWILIGIVLWAALAAIVFYSPALVIWGWEAISAKVAAAGGIVAALYALVGARLAWSDRTGKQGSSPGLDIYVRSLPPVLALGLLIALSFLIYRTVTPGAIGTNRQIPTTSVAASAEEGGSGGTVPASGSETLKDVWGRYWPSMENVKGCADSRVLVLGKDILGFFELARSDQGALATGFAAVCILLLLVAVLMSARVDINDFSLQLFYRNRLVRAYLGATRQPNPEKCMRDPDRFTGFDPKDDVFLAKLARGAKLDECEKDYSGPYPIINTTLNLTHGERLAWQERQAESFIMTPLYCGYDTSMTDRPQLGRKPDKRVEEFAYRPTAQYAYPDGGIFLGTAFATSGAAASPNMGSHTSAPLAFLMTVLNIRLGWWLGNPRRKDRWQKGSPTFALRPLLHELFADANDKSRYVYLSDGGHFENLGIYELVRRRCRLILACDASADPDYTFEDLGNAVRKCRDDFGVDVEINVNDLRPPGISSESQDDDFQTSGQHCAVGLIRYDKVWEDSKPGILVYIKSSLTGDEPADVLEYRRTHEAFPHDSTANQWFAESQFESYRKLGEHIIGKCSQDISEAEAAASTPGASSPAEGKSEHHPPHQKKIGPLELMQPPHWEHWTKLSHAEDLMAYLARHVRGFEA